MKRVLLLLLLTLLGLSAKSQTEATQVVSGRVLTNVGEPLVGATVSVMDVTPEKGIATDGEGRFRLMVPLGRQMLKVRSVGYQDRELSLLVVTGEELNLEVRLEPATYNLEGVEVVRYYNKSRAIQPLTYAGARSFSVEETERYAGSLGDPSRMVRSFAGVMPINDSRNEIVVRGNSPLGVQYRLDGIEVLNPNHFNAGIGMTAGQVTALNMNLVTNSDFLLGGWSATKGNALSAIFDLNLRKGLSHRHQMRFQMGYNGLELMAEGPLSRDGKVTYIASYRYSIPELMSYAMKLFNKEMPIVPKYQDFTAKVDWAINDDHRLSLIVLAGGSGIYIDTKKLNSDSGSTVSVDESSIDQRVDLKSNLALAGLVYKGQLSPRTDLRSTLSWNYSRVNMDVVTRQPEEGSQYELLFNDRSHEHKLSLSADLHHRLNTNKDHLYLGTVLDMYLLNMYNEVEGIPYPVNDDRGRLSLGRLYAQYQHLFSDALSATVGVHSSFLPLNKHWTVEPRAGAEWKIGSQHTIGLAGGLYSQLPPHTFYFVKTADGSYSEENRQLDFSKSWHANLSYNFQINKEWRIHTELYYQWLFDIPAEPKAYGASLLNFGAGENYIERYAGLKNIGKGRNYGVELTVEKFFSKNYFFLLSGTLYRSRYTDPILNKEFSTAFDGGYIVNLTGGVEWPLKGGRWTIFASPQVALAGGLHYTLVDERASKAAGEIIYQTDKWAEAQLPAYLRIDTRIGVRNNGKKISQEWGIDLINITNRKNIALKAYDLDRGEYITQTHFSFFPMITYRLHFGI